MESNRIKWVDYAKGIGIILVVYGHVLRGINTSPIMVPDLFFQLSDKLVYGFHMPLFYLLSGLFLEKWMDRGVGGIIQKCKTLMIPYIIWSLLQGSINVILSSYTNTPKSWLDIFSIFATPIAQFWFLYTLFIMFLLYFIFRKFFSLYIIGVLSIIMYFFAPFMEVWVFSDLFSFFIYFITGAIIMKSLRFDLGLVNFTPKYILFSLVTFVVLNIIYLSFEINPYIEHLFEFLVAASGINIITVIAIKNINTNKSKHILILGRYSMPIFLTHILFTAGLRIMLLSLLDVNSVVLHITLGTILGLVLPIGLYRFLKKYKCNETLFGR